MFVSLFPDAPLSAANFWDLNYLLVLIAIAWIWRPGPDSYQYAFSSQIAGSEQDAETGGPDSADFDGACVCAGRTRAPWRDDPHRVAWQCRLAVTVVHWPCITHSLPHVCAPRPGHARADVPPPGAFSIQTEDDDEDEDGGAADKAPAGKKTTIASAGGAGAVSAVDGDEAAAAKR